MLEQEAALRAQGAESKESLHELAQIVLDLERRLSELQTPPAA